MEKWRLIYLAKNMKAFYLASAETIKLDLAFLKKRFRYRRIAILNEQIRLLPQPVSEPLVIIDKTEIGPLPDLKIIDEFFGQILSLASLFMVPILSSKALVTEWPRFFCWTRRREKPFSVQEFRFVLRLLTYIPIDFAEKEEERIISALKKNHWANYLKSRTERLRRDAEKRFWRWPEEASGDVRVGLVDPLSFFSSFSLDQIPFSFPVGIYFLPDEFFDRGMV